jgi:hypothetical protein
VCKGHRRHLIEPQRFVAVLLAGAPLPSPEVRCRGNAAAGRDRDADVEHRHFSSGERAHQHQLVQVAQMSDAEHTAGHLRQSRAQCEVVAPKGDVDHARTIDAFGDDDRADGIRIPFRRLGA